MADPLDKEARRLLIMERFTVPGRPVPPSWRSFVQRLNRERPASPSVDNGYRPGHNGRANRTTEPPPKDQPRENPEGP